MHGSQAAEQGDYRERYVAFLDLLGFKALVKSAESDAVERERLLEILRLLRDTLCENPKLGMRFTHFSDCIVLSIDRTAAGLWEAFQSIDLLTFYLLQFDCLIRGGLVAGGVHHSERFVYGTAVNEAHRLESECAENPMTLVSQEIVDDAAGYGAHFLEWLLEDAPTRHFIHYLRQYADYRPSPPLPGMMIMDEPAKRVTDFICHRLNVDTGRVLAKSQWFRAYWNRTVASRGTFRSIESGVTERYISRGPTIGVRRIVGGG
jgi:hypothetical protein